MKKLDIFSQQISTPKNNEQNGFTMLNNLSISLVKCETFSEKKRNNLFKNEEMPNENNQSSKISNETEKLSLESNYFENLETEFEELKETYNSYRTSFRNKLLNYSECFQLNQIKVLNEDLHQYEENIENLKQGKKTNLPPLNMKIVDVKQETDESINKFNNSEISSMDSNLYQNKLDEKDIIVSQINYIHHLLFNSGENNDSNICQLSNKLNDITEFVENNNTSNKRETDVIHEIMSTYENDYDFINKLKSDSVKRTFKRKIANIYDKIEKLQLSLKQMDD